MRVAVFFVCLFLLLLGGYTCVYTGGEATTQPVIKAQQKKFTHTDREYAVIKEVGSDKEEEYLVGDNVEEDEETSNSSARKYRLLARCYLALSSHLSYLHSGPKSPPALCHTLSYKYITQGVLRI